MVMDNSLHKSTLTFHCNRIEQNGWEEIILFDEATGAKAIIIPSAGGILNAFETNHQGKSINIIDGFIDAEDWKKNLNNGHKSSKLSPFVCRLFNSTYNWEGKNYTTESFKLNGHAIHGLLHAVSHEVMIAEASAFMAECKLFYRYKGTDPGYPFAFDMNIRYRLEAGSRLTIITTVHNRSGRNIPMADGWHPYFKLGESIDTATLQINSKKEVEFNDLLIPTRKIISNNKWFKAASLKDVSLDNCFELMPDEPLPHCTLSDPALGVALYIYPDRSYPYLQVYTPPHRKSIAIENLSSAPDAFNNKMGLIELGPEDSKGFTTRLRIATIEPPENKKGFWEKLFG
jgi:aldose 1-epimerase